MSKIVLVVFLLFSSLVLANQGFHPVFEPYLALKNERKWQQAIQWGDSHAQAVSENQQISLLQRMDFIHDVGNLAIYAQRTQVVDKMLRLSEALSKQGELFFSVRHQLFYSSMLEQSKRDDEALASLAAFIEQVHNSEEISRFGSSFAAVSAQVHLATRMGKPAPCVALDKWFKLTELELSCDKLRDPQAVGEQIGSYHFKDIFDNRIEIWLPAGQEVFNHANNILNTMPYNLTTLSLKHDLALQYFEHLPVEQHYPYQALNVLDAAIRDWEQFTQPDPEKLADLFLRRAKLLVNLAQDLGPERNESKEMAQALMDIEKAQSYLSKDKRYGKLYLDTIEQYADIVFFSYYRGSDNLIQRVDRELKQIVNANPDESYLLFKTALLLLKILNYAPDIARFEDGESMIESLKKLNQSLMPLLYGNDFSDCEVYSADLSDNLDLLLRQYSWQQLGNKQFQVEDIRQCMLQAIETSKKHDDSSLMEFELERLSEWAMAALKTELLAEVGSVLSYIEQRLPKTSVWSDVKEMNRNLSQTTALHQSLEKALSEQTPCDLAWMPPDFTAELADRVDFSLSSAPAEPDNSMFSRQLDLREEIYRAQQPEIDRIITNLSFARQYVITQNFCVAIKMLDETIELLASHNFEKGHPWVVEALLLRTRMSAELGNHSAANSWARITEQHLAKFKAVFEFSPPNYHLALAATFSMLKLPAQAEPHLRLTIDSIERLEVLRKDINDKSSVALAAKTWRSFLPFMQTRAALVYLIRTLLQQGKYKEAIDIQNQVIIIDNERFSQNPNLMLPSKNMVLGDLHLLDGKIAAARKIYQQQLAYFSAIEPTDTLKDELLQSTKKLAKQHLNLRLAASMAASDRDAFNKALNKSYGNAQSLALLRKNQLEAADMLGYYDCQLPLVEQLMKPQQQFLLLEALKRTSNGENPDLLPAVFVELQVKLRNLVADQFREGIAKARYRRLLNEVRIEKFQQSNSNGLRYDSELLIRCSDIDYFLPEVSESWRTTQYRSTEIISDIRNDKASDNFQQQIQQNQQMTIFANLTKEGTADKDFVQYLNERAFNPVQLNELKTILPADAAIFSAVWLQGKGYVLLIQKQSAALFPMTMDERQFIGHIKTVRSYLESGKDIDSRYLQNAYALYRGLFGDIEKSFENDIKQLLIVNSGNLGTIPFPALISQPNNGNGQPAWLIRKQMSMAMIPSFRALLLKTQDNPNNQSKLRLVGFGNPIFGKDKQSCFTSTGEIPPLCTLRETAKLLSSLDGRVERFVGYGADDFTEANFNNFVGSTRSRDFNVLLFASHALRAGESKQLFGINEPAIVMSHPIVGKDKAADGILTSSEIAKLSLPFEFAILAGCNTGSGLGTEDSSPLTGLASAFLYAGTKSIFYTHYEVSANSTMSLLQHMLLKGNLMSTPAQSLMQAQLSLLNGESFKRYQHPRYWAAIMPLLAGLYNTSH